MPQDQDYVIITDDSCDMPPAFYAEREIPTLCLSFTIDGQTYKGNEMSPERFYELMREGKTPTTAQVNVDEFTQFFTPYLEEGTDILYLAFSSGLSGTCGSAKIAAEGLRERYPDRRIEVVDTLCASMGQGLFVHKVDELRKQGKSLDELVEWAEANKLRLAHMVTVEDLMHLHRGGRISRTSAVMGSMLGIKPMIHMDDEGKLVNVGKVRGRRQSLQRVVEMMAEAVGDTPNDVFYVCHSDCREDAEYVADLVEQRWGIKEREIHFIGPVIGTHTGPGTVALFMMANHR